jgi:hypothetical protein
MFWMLEFTKVFWKWYHSDVFAGVGGTRMLGSCKVLQCDQCDKGNIVLSLKEEEELLNNFEKKFFHLSLDGKSRVQAAVC